VEVGLRLWYALVYYSIVWWVTIQFKVLLGCPLDNQMPFGVCVASMSAHIISANADPETYRQRYDNSFGRYRTWPPMWGTFGKKFFMYEFIADSGRCLIPELMFKGDRFDSEQILRYSQTKFDRPSDSTTHVGDPWEKIFWCMSLLQILVGARYLSLCSKAIDLIPSRSWDIAKQNLQASLPRL
jgi:hypothetical protein